MRSLAALLLAGLLAACMPSSQALTDRPWKLVEVGGAFPVADGGISFGADGRVTVSPGCNSGGGTYAIEANRITIDGLAITEIGCEDAVNAQEQEFLRVLDAGPRFEIETRTGRLRLTTDDGVLVFEGP